MEPNRGSSIKKHSVKGGFEQREKLNNWHRDPISTWSFMVPTFSQDPQALQSPGGQGVRLEFPEGEVLLASLRSGFLCPQQPTSH